MKTIIYDLDKYSVNERNGMYGGKAGDKEGITINNEYWIVKYPKSTNGMKGDIDSYTTSPLSEYIGSHIYKFLNIDVHDTILGIRNNKLVVACKDFCDDFTALREIRTLKNIYIKELEDYTLKMFSSTSDSHYIDVEDIYTYLEYNSILYSIPDIKNRFWEQFFVDLFINNNDRNNGNWGLLYNNLSKSFKLAPVFDNGASFSTKTPESKILVMSKDLSSIEQSVNSNTSIYRIKGHRIHCKDLKSVPYSEFKDVVLSITPKLVNCMDYIKDFILGIPNNYNGIPVCSTERGQVYYEMMKIKLNNYYIPLYEKIKSESD